MKNAARASYSEPIREKALRHFVVPARESGKREFTISVRELMDMFPHSFSFNRQGQFCTALVKRSFLDENDIEIVDQTGPASKRSTTVSYNYRFKKTSQKHQDVRPLTETQARAESQRLVEGLRGLLRKEIAAYGGADAFIRWVRSEEPCR